MSPGGGHVPCHTHLCPHGPGCQHVPAVVEPVWLHFGVTGPVVVGEAVELGCALEHFHVVHQGLVACRDHWLVLQSPRRKGHNESPPLGMQAPQGRNIWELVSVSAIGWGGKAALGTKGFMFNYGRVKYLGASKGKQHVVSAQGTFWSVVEIFNSLAGLGTNPEPTENQLILSPATDPGDQQILVCFGMTESFTSFVGLRWPWGCCFFLQRGLAVLLL